MIGVPLSTEVSPGRRWRDRLLVLALGALVFLPGLGNHDLWNPDEPRYAEVAREMRLTGEFLVPHLNGKLYTEKPPLHFWTIAAAAWVRGELDETAARLPSALAAMGTLLLVFALGRRLFGYRAAWLAVAVLATSARILWQGRVGQIDMQLVFWVTLAMYFWLRGLQEQRPGFYPLFFVATGLAGLAKGPAGLLPPLLAIVVFLLLTGRRQELRQFRIGRGLLLWLGIMLAWLVPAGLTAGSEYFQQLAFRQNLGRYANPWGHHQPWYYFLTVIPGDFFPWSFFLPTALVVGWRRLRGGLARGLRDSYLLCLCWMVVTLVFFSLSPGKRTVYILTMYPAMALLVGAAFDRLALEWPQHRRWLAVPPALLAVLLGTAAALLPRFAARRPEVALLDPLVPRAVVAGLAVLALSALVATVLALGRRPLAVPVVLAATLGTVLVAGLVYLLPHFEPFKSVRGLTGQMVQEMAPGERYAIFPRIDPPLIFYSQRFAEIVSTGEELQRFAGGTERVWVMAERDDLAKVEVPLNLVEVARGVDEVDGYILLTTPPWPRPQGP